MEVSGNKIVNECYEALVTNEKDGRNKRKYGHEAYFFEKFVNRTYFDQVLYKQLISESSKSLVEMRVNRQLRGFNVKKMATEGGEEFDPEGSFSARSDEDQLVGSEVSSRQRPREHRVRKGREGLEKTPSIRDRRTLQKKRLSAKNIFGADSLLDEKKDDQSVTSRRTQMSSARINSVRRDVMGENGDTRSQGMRRAQSSSRIRLDVDERANRKDARANMRRAVSNPKIQLGGDGNANGVRRSCSRRRLGSSGSISRLHGSFSSLKMNEENDNTPTNRQNARFGGARRSNSGARLNASLTGLSFDTTGDDDDDDDDRAGLSRRSSSRGLKKELKF